MVTTLRGRDRHLTGHRPVARRGRANAGRAAGGRRAHRCRAEPHLGAGGGRDLRRGHACGGGHRADGGNRACGRDPFRPCCSPQGAAPRQRRPHRARYSPHRRRHRTPPGATTTASAGFLSAFLRRSHGTSRRDLAVRTPSSRFVESDLTDLVAQRSAAPRARGPAPRPSAPARRRPARLRQPGWLRARRHLG